MILRRGLQSYVDQNIKQESLLCLSINMTLMHDHVEVSYYEKDIFAGHVLKSSRRSRGATTI